jgi:AbrB family looped-hinge helix DNA binding protein
MELGMPFTRVSRKGQITLHKEVRNKLGIKPGDVLEEEVVNGEIILKLSEMPSVTLKGIGKKTKERLKVVNATELVRSMRREDREEL